MTLFEMATDLLEGIVQQAATNDVELPSRKLIYMSPIPADCEQVVVMFNGWGLLQDTGTVENCMTSPLLAGFSMLITRKTPALPKVGTKNPLPAVGAMEAAAKIASDDAEIFRDLLFGLGAIASPQIVVQSPVGGYQTVELNVSLMGS